MERLARSKGGRFVALASASLVSLILAGCGGVSEEPTTMDGARSTLYSSVQELAAASSVVAIGTVSGQEIRKESTDHAPVTLQKFQIVQTLQPDSLGSSLAQGKEQLGELSLITVRQLGTPEMSRTPAPLLVKGETYMLFLTPTMIDGAPADEFYVTGGEAGIYALSSPREELSSLNQQEISGLPFTRVSDDGDQIPTSLTPEQLDD